MRNMVKKFAETVISLELPRSKEMFDSSVKTSEKREAALAKNNAILARMSSDTINALGVLEVYCNLKQVTNSSSFYDLKS